MTTTAQITNKAMKLLAGRDSATLIADYLATDTMIDNASGDARQHLVVTRGWIMDTLEARGDDGLLAVALGFCPLCWATMDGDHCPDGCCP